MVLIEATDRSTNKRVLLVHDTMRDGKEHVITAYEPNPAAGPLAGKKLWSLVMDARAAKELKAHL